MPIHFAEHRAVPDLGKISIGRTAGPTTQVVEGHRVPIYLTNKLARAHRRALDLRERSA